MDASCGACTALVSADTGDELQLVERAATRGWFLHAVDWRLWLLGPASLLLVFAAGLLLVRRVLRPLRTLSDELDARARLATASSCSRRMRRPSCSRSCGR